MTKLKPIRRRLASLRHWRSFVRRTTALSAVLTACLWLLVAVFAVDVVLELDELQRAITLVVAAGGVVWAYRRYASPLLGVRETDMQMALMVEKRQHINSDLVAALQFESDEAVTWGSIQLEDAVISYVADLGRTLDVFQGFSREQMIRRALLLLATAALVGAGITQFPDYAETFWNRLLLGRRHYPSHTRIEQVLVNHQLVLPPGDNGVTLQPAKCPQNHALTLLVQCSGVLPEHGLVRLRSTAGPLRPLDLQPLSLDSRRARLEDAAARIRKAVEKHDQDLAGTWAAELEALTRFDAPRPAAQIAAAAGETSKLAKAAAEIDAVLKAWPGSAESTALFSAQIERLADPLTYQLFLGDAWTDPASIDMIALPIIEPVLTPVLPSYVKVEQEAAPSSNARQLAVLEGSGVQVAIECTNHKRLKKAWITVVGEPDQRRYALQRQDEDGFRWTLPIEKTPFARITRELRFEIQVTDEDDLHLEPAIRSYVRLKADRPPTCSADVVHRVVLPTAKPKISYRATDDYGLSELRLLAVVEHERKDATDSKDAKEEVATVSLLTGERPRFANHLPVLGQFQLDLTALKVRHNGQEQPVQLVKGDRVRLTLEAVDFRGEAAGVSYQGDPLVLEISDEAGVLSAISEADERSEKRISDIIKEQLGIGGGSP